MPFKNDLPIPLHGGAVKVNSSIVFPTLTISPFLKLSYDNPSLQKSIVIFSPAVPGAIVCPSACNLIIFWLSYTKTARLSPVWEFCLSSLRPDYSILAVETWRFGTPPSGLTFMYRIVATIMYV